MPTENQDTSGKIFDTVTKKFDLKNDAALAAFLNISAPSISKIRTGRLHVSDSILLRIHETTNIAVADLRKMLPK